MAGAVFDDDACCSANCYLCQGLIMRLFFGAGAVFFVAGAVFGEMWNDSRSAIAFFKMLVVGVKGKFGCGLTVSWSDHGRIIFSFGHFSWQA